MRPDGRMGVLVMHMALNNRLISSLRLAVFTWPLRRVDVDDRSNDPANRHKGDRWIR